MSKEQENELRKRDDADLHRLVSETRAWMKVQGIKEKELDWEATAREEAALWWKARMQQAVERLARQGSVLGQSVVARLRALAAAAEAQAEAALEVSFDVAKRTGLVRPEPAEACLRPGARMQFRYAPQALPKRGRLQTALRLFGTFKTPVITGARVLADAAKGMLTVEFQVPPPASLVVMVPEDPDVASQVAEVKEGMDRVTFSGLQDGRYLLAVYPLEEETP